MSKISDLVIETSSLEEQITELTNKYNANLARIQKYFDKTGTAEVRCKPDKGDSDKEIKAVELKRTYIKYDIDKLKDNLPKDIYNEIIDRTYTINNIDKMLELVKEAGVGAKEFKALLDIDTKINNGNLKQKFKIGEIKIDDLKGTYTLNTIKSVKITKG